jgi:LmbE family N-acetylglucosaminyl deacetylase
VETVMLAVVAHPDDETFGLGSAIANAAGRGVRVVVCCATRGEAGEDASGTTSGPAELAPVREAELRAAARVLGASEVVLLDFADSGLDGELPPRALTAVDLEEVVAPLAALVQRVEPDVVVTFDPESVTDHRDHVRIGEAATVAFARAAKPSARLYHWTLVRSTMTRWLAEMKAQGLLQAYVEMELGRPDDEITTIVDVSHVMDVRRAAIAEHRTQVSPLSGASPELEAEVLSFDHFVRAVPPWDGGPRERSLFGDG